MKNIGASYVFSTKELTIFFMNKEFKVTCDKNELNKISKHFFNVKAVETIFWGNEVFSVVFYKTEQPFKNKKSEIKQLTA